LATKDAHLPRHENSSLPELASQPANCTNQLAVLEGVTAD
jgi:hypothetical protein